MKFKELDKKAQMKAAKDYQEELIKVDASKDNPLGFLDAYTALFEDEYKQYDEEGELK